MLLIVTLPFRRPGRSRRWPSGRRTHGALEHRARLDLDRVGAGDRRRLLSTSFSRVEPTTRPPSPCSVLARTKPELASDEHEQHGERRGFSWRDCISGRASGQLAVRESAAAIVTRASRGRRTGGAARAGGRDPCGPRARAAQVAGIPLDELGQVAAFHAATARSFAAERQAIRRTQGSRMPARVGSDSDHTGSAMSTARSTRCAARHVARQPCAVSGVTSDAGATAASSPVKIGSSG